MGQKRQILSTRSAASTRVNSDLVLGVLELSDFLGKVLQLLDADIHGMVAVNILGIHPGKLTRKLSLQLVVTQLSIGKTAEMAGLGLSHGHVLRAWLIGGSPLHLNRTVHRRLAFPFAAEFSLAGAWLDMGCG